MATLVRHCRPLVLLLAGLLLLGACKAELYRDLSAREANEMVAILLDHGIAAERRVDKNGLASVIIDDGRFADAVHLLKSAGYPRETFTNTGEIFANSGMIASPREERARFIFALSQELAESISQIDGVVSARVHIVLPENSPLRQERGRSSAAVFIRHVDRADIGMLVPEIRSLVANGIEGVVYDNVSVALFATPLADRPIIRNGRGSVFGGLLPTNGTFLTWLVIASLVVGIAGFAIALALFVLWRRDNRQTPLVQALRGGLR